MQFPQKTTADLSRAFDDALPDDPRLERRTMFGFPAGFVGGNMFAGTYGQGVVVKLPDAERARAIEQGARAFEPTPGRVMREYVVVPPVALADEAQLRGWVQRAFDYVAALPPKDRTKPRKKAR
ncbi:MAG TPA: TfoX/Sxy family protein [Chloroflexota bacterium]|nr:TfoX/Sxy family protein [Chloroflexota bacterium]